MVGGPRYLATRRRLAAGESRGWGPVWPVRAATERHVERGGCWSRQAGMYGRYVSCFAILMRAAKPLLVMILSTHSLNRRVDETNHSNFLLRQWPHARPVCAQHTLICKCVIALSHLPCYLSFAMCARSARDGPHSSCAILQPSWRGVRMCMPLCRTTRASQRMSRQKRWAARLRQRPQRLRGGDVGL